MNQLSKIKEKLLLLNTKELIGIISELYTLSQQNENFCNARLLNNTDDVLEVYKQLIRKYMYPDLTKRNQDISLSSARKAISEYKRATGSLTGTLELMVYYIECGHKFTQDYGDIDERFYDSLISMFDKVIELLKLHLDLKEIFYSRLKCISDDSRNFGWGYDHLYYAHREFFHH